MPVWGACSRFKSDTDGATLIYVTIMAAVLVGMAGFAIDFARLQTTKSHAQDAADAAALAAASQLDGTPTAIQRATDAATNAALVSNSQDLAENAGVVGIASIRFISDLPANDDSPITAYTSNPEAANFVEVTTATLTHRNLFLQAVGVAETTALDATAVAGQEAAICQVTPLAICNPNEAGGNVGASFNLQNWVGKQLLVRNAGPNAQWAPGNFGLLDTPNDGQGAPELANMLASVEGANQCFSTRLNTRPGQVGSLRSALNTRFDMYENPFFQNADNDPLYPPAPNVTKGYVPAVGNNGNPGTINQFCNGNIDEPGAPTAMGLPRDTNISSTQRFGNGDWDCAGYWAVNHSSTPPAGCTSTSPGISRWGIYNYEIDNGVIPGPATGAAEDGSPVCSSQPAAGPDRRLVNFAVINCIENNVNGNMTDLPSEAFVRAFLTEPVGDESAPGNGDFDVYLEIVEVVQSGEQDGPLKEWVEIFR